MPKDILSPRLREKGFSGHIRPSASLAELTSWKVGGRCRFYLEPKTFADLRLACGLLAEEKIPWKIIGGGTNLLVADEGIDEVVISLGSISGSIRAQEDVFWVPAGMRLPQLLKWQAQNGFGGLEFTAGVPATVGGAVINNFSAYGRSISQFWTKIKVLDGSGRIREIKKEKVNFGEHQSSLLGQKLILLEVALRLSRLAKVLVKENIRQFLQKRSADQPLKFPTAGCVFRNPPGQPAGWLLEQAGCKGLKVGLARVSDFHANFIISRGGAKAADILQLLKKMIERVKDKFDLTLEPEVELWAKQTSWAEILSSVSC